MLPVGRRLGYPLKLVEAPGHLFFRWEDPQGTLFNVPETFNVEGTGPGMSFYPDEYYRTWPRAWKPHERTSGWYLKSMSPVEELACFLATRGSCLESNGRIAEAVQAFKWAAKLLPDDLRYESKYVELLKQSYEESMQALEAERRMLELDRMMLEQKQRRLAESQMGFPAQRNVPPHGGSCQCLPCRQARQPARQMPGHPPGCGCFGCRGPDHDPFNSW